MKRFLEGQVTVLEKKLRLSLPPKIALLARSAGLSTDAMVARVLVSA